MKRNPHTDIRLRRNAAFTLVEMLCVIALIAILATILIPVIGRMRLEAQLSRSVANVRTLQSVNMLSLAERNGMGAPVIADGAPWYRNEEFMAYLGGSIPEGIRSPLAALNSAGRGYGANISTLDIDDRDRDGGLRVAIERVANPAVKLAWMDSLDWWIMRQYADRYNGIEQSMVHTPAYRYGGRAAAAFWDGHAAVLSREEVVGNHNLWNIYQ